MPRRAVGSNVSGRPNFVEAGLNKRREEPPTNTAPQLMLHNRHNFGGEGSASRRAS